MRKLDIKNFAKKFVTEDGLKDLTKTFTSGVKKHSPELLVAVGIAGMFSTIFLAIKATPKAMKKKSELEENATNPTKMDYVRKIAPVYIPTTIAAFASAACIISGVGIKEKRNAALMAAYKLSETAFKEYKEATLETVGKKKEDEIHEKIIEKSFENTPMKEEEIIDTRRGDTLFKDMASGRYFRSDVEYIRSAVNDFNAFLMADNARTLNDFYDQIDLDRVYIGDIIGWTYFGDGNVKENFLNVRFTPVLKDGKTPCVGIEYDLPYRYSMENYVY